MYLYILKYVPRLPGPASTVEERSLRKNSVRGDRGSKLAVGDFSFQMLYAQISGGCFNIGQVNQLSQPR